MGVVEVDTSRDAEDTPRVYLSNGVIAHNVLTPVTNDSRCVFCGRGTTSGWKGLNSEYEKLRALKLPYCKEKQ